MKIPHEDPHQYLEPQREALNQTLDALDRNIEALQWTIHRWGLTLVALMAAAGIMITWLSSHEEL